MGGSWLSGTVLSCLVVILVPLAGLARCHPSGSSPLACWIAVTLLSTALFLLAPGSPLAVLPLFPLLVACHAALALSPAMSLALAATLITIHIALSAAHTFDTPSPRFYTQVKNYSELFSVPFHRCGILFKRVRFHCVNRYSKSFIISRCMLLHL